MIIHTLDTITLRQYAAFEKTGDVRKLYHFFGWLARFGLFMDDIQAFVTSFNKAFNPKADDDLVKQVEKLRYQNKVVMMQALAEAIHLHLVTRIEMKIMCERIGMKLPEDKNLLKYLDHIKELTGLEITNLDDVKGFNEEVQRKIDKFREIFAEKHPVKGSSIMELYFACCSILEQSPDYTQMTLAEFAEFKLQADEKAKRMEEMYNKPR